jgi:hypothetical protein
MELAKMRLESTFIAVIANTTFSSASAIQANNTVFSMIANNTLSCNSFDSLTSLILAVSVSRVNVSDQIQLCPQLCSLACGIGNPDFSGVGVRSNS